jgi:hypothetical protein
VKSTTDLVVPFGALTQTDNNRLIFWPVLPKNHPQVSNGARLIDHITLELSNGKSHSTAFDEEGVRQHRRAGWKLHQIPGSGLKMWFSMLVRWDVIQNQDLRVEVEMATPFNDSLRREKEFRKHAAHFSAQFLVVPEGQREGDYVYCVFYLQEADSFDVAPLQESFLGDNVDDRIAGIPDGTVFPIHPATLQIGKTRLLALAATPIGSTTSDIVFGFPHSRVWHRDRM